MYKIEIFPTCQINNVAPFFMLSLHIQTKIRVIFMARSQISSFIKYLPCFVEFPTVIKTDYFRNSETSPTTNTIINIKLLAHRLSASAVVKKHSAKMAQEIIKISFRVFSQHQAEHRHMAGGVTGL